MSDLYGIPTHRTLRLYEWLALLAMMLIAAGAHAESVYKCPGHDVVAYQSKPCADMSVASVIDLGPAPAFALSPHYAISTARPETKSSKRIARVEREPVKDAFECRGSDGTVFYRLGHCPRSVGGSDDKGRHGSKSSAAKSVSVSGHAVSRDEACAQMSRAGAIGRKGHEFDETISTYDRNVGNDPCK